MLRTIRHRKTAVLAALLALLAFQASGWLVAWQAARFDARRTAGAMLHQPETETCRVTLTTTALANARVDNREIRLHGRLFDIRSAEPCGDSVRLLLYHDVREEALYEALGNLLAPAFCNNPAVPATSAPFYLFLLNWMHAAFLLPEMPAWRLNNSVEQQNHFPFLIPGSQLRLPRPGPPPEPFGDIQYNNEAREGL